MRIVKEFKDFYQIKDFKKIGRNLAKSIILYFNLQHKELETARDKINKQADKFYDTYSKKR